MARITSDEIVCHDLMSGIMILAELKKQQGNRRILGKIACIFNHVLRNIWPDVHQPPARPTRVKRVAASSLPLDFDFGLRIHIFPPSPSRTSCCGFRYINICQYGS